LSLALPNTVNFQVSQKTRIDDSVLSIQMRLPTSHCSMYFSCPAATVSIKSLAVLWDWRCNKGKLLWSTFI
jgi:hypothetical protein